MTRNSSLFCKGAFLVVVGADAVTAHPRSIKAIDSARLVGSADFTVDKDRYEAGKQLLREGDIIAALAAFQQASTTTPLSADALNGIGVCYDRLGRDDLARKYYRAGLTLSPDDAALSNNLGYSLYLSGNLAAAVEPLRVAAASSNREVSAAATATLARLTQTPQVTIEPMRVAPRLAAQIETTSDGEQRLTFAPAPLGDEVAPLGDQANTVIVAAEWTVADDQALSARVVAEQQLADAAVGRSDNKVMPASLQLTIKVSQDAVHKSSLPVERVARPDWALPDRLASALIHHAGVSDAMVAPRRELTFGRTRSPTIGDDPRTPATVAFDSDDVELNAFATRVAKGAAVRATASENSRRITTRFRA